MAAGTVAPRDFERRITMPFTAFLRWLGRTSHLLERSSYAQAPMMQKMMVSHLTNADIIERSRVHPFTILAALATYRTGRGDKGSLTWPVNQASEPRHFVQIRSTLVVIRLSNMHSKHFPRNFHVLMKQF